MSSNLAIKLEQKEIVEQNLRNSSERMQKTFTDELVIGICGQLGVDLSLVVKDLKDIFISDFGYQCEEIKMSDLIFEATHMCVPTDFYDRITIGMDKGNELREKYSEQILADLAITQISKSRVEETPKDDLEKEKFSSRRKCFIINSLKHPKEYELLKTVYSDSFYLLGVFSPYEERVKFLSSKFYRKNYSLIDSLINRDTAEDIQNGQNVESVFVNSDYFIRTAFNDDNISTKLSRFTNLIFDYNINTPTIEERAMYQASSASVNSACLSRQVGACITDNEGHILSLGWNDVPSFGGGVYQMETCTDERCYIKKYCSNSQKKDEILNSIISELKSENIITNEQRESTEKILKKNGIKNLTEFARSIHAEMHAIIIGSQQTGNKMIGGKLFCTTYPCHNCARHIVLAGIREVYYIEPYRKSLCIELHNDSITEDEKLNEKVRILMYEGVAPKSFMKFYQLNSDNRKNKINNQDKKLLSPKYRITLRALHQLEAISVKYLSEINLIEQQ